MLRAEVSGPSGSVDVDIDTYTPGKNIIEFTPQEEGKEIYFCVYFTTSVIMKHSQALFCIKYEIIQNDWSSSIHQKPSILKMNADSI